MVDRYSSEILAVVTAIEWDDAPTLTVLHLALFGGMYNDATDLSGDDVYYDGRIKSDIILDKQIGIEFWREESAIDFGFLDIALEDQNDDLIDFGDNVTVADVDFYRVNLSDPDSAQIEILASARSSDIGFANESTLRLRLGSILEDGFTAPINEKYYGYEYPQLTGSPYPIAWGLITDPQQVIPTIEVDGTTLDYHITDIEIDSFESVVYDRGVALTQPAQFTPTTYGFTLNQNPDGRIVSGRVLLFDPLDTGNHFHGLFRFFRLAMTRANIWQYANESELTQLETDIGFGDLFPQYFTHNVVSLESFMKTILEGVTGWYYVDELSEIHFGRMTPPEDESAPPFDFTDANVVGRIKVDDDKAPGLSSRLSYAYNPGAYDPSDIAGGVYGYDRVDLTTLERFIIQNGYYANVYWSADSIEWSADSTIYTADGYGGLRFVNPVELLYWNRVSVREPIPIAIAYSDDSPSAYDLAQGEIDRWWSELYPVRRRFYTFDVQLNDSQFITGLPQLGDFCTLQSDRFGLLETAKHLFIRKLRFNFSKNLLTVVGWG